MKRPLGLAMTWAICTMLSGVAKGQNSPGILDPFAIITYKDSAGVCTPQRADAGSISVAGCCAGPGRRSCTGAANGYSLPSCLTIDSAHTTDAYGAGLLCNLPPVTVDSLLPTLGQSGTDVTFYVTSDLHFFRRTYNLTDQLTHVQVLKNFFSTGAVWPSGAGIPDNTPIDKPLAVVIDGDFTTEGTPEQLQAYRISYERGTLPTSLPYPVMVGMGNHEVNNVTSENGKRMFDYVQTRMGNTHIDALTGNYSWDWQGIHMVQMGTWAGDKSSVWAHPSDGLAWLTNDLKTYVGNTTKPVMLFEHFLLKNVYPWRPVGEHGFFPSNANATDSSGAMTGQGYEAFWNIIKNYNVIGMFGGHTHCPGIYSTLLDTLPIREPLYPGVATYDKPMDNFSDGSGGDSHGNVSQQAGIGNPCEPTEVDGQSIPGTGVGNFLVTHVNQHYLDVALVSWMGDGKAPYFDRSLGSPTAAAACRKRINSQFLLAPGLASVTTTSSGYTVMAPKGTPVGIPVALKVGSRSGVSGFSFVDGCADDGDLGSNNLYFLVNGESALSAGNTYSVPAAGASGVRTDLVVLTPMSGATPVSIAHVVGQGSMTSDIVTVYGPASGKFTVVVGYSGNASGWLTVPGSGAFDVYGMASLSLKYSLPVAGYGTSSAVMTVTTAGTGVVQNVTVSVTSPTITLAQSTATIYSGGIIQLGAKVVPVISGMSVVFTSGAATLGSGTTDASGVVTVNWTTGAVGAYPIVAAITGTNVASAAQTVTVVAPFEMTLAPLTMTVLPGKSGNVALSVSGMGGFTGTASWQCSTPVAYVTCAPASGIVGVSGTANVVISVAANVGRDQRRSGVELACLGFAAILLMCRRRALRHSCLIAVCVGISGCGSGKVSGMASPVSPSPAPTGSQVVTVIAIAGGFTQTQNVTVYFQ